MAGPVTTNLSVTLPEVGADDETWGGINNVAHQAWDAVFAAGGGGTSVGLNVGSGKTLAVAGTLTITGTATIGGSALVSLAGTQTLTNKTLTSPTINTGAISGGTINSAVIGGSTPAAGTFTTATVTTAVILPDGTAGAPSLRFANDADSGFYSVSDGQIGVAIDGVQVAVFDETGLVGEISGNVETATALQTPRDFSLTGDATGTGEDFDGTENLSIPVTLATTGISAGTYTKLTVDAKGRATGGANISSLDVTTALTYTPAQSVALTGDVTGSASVNGSGAISISTTVASNAVALGANTTGNYVGAGATSGNGLSGSTSSEGGTFTVTSNATSTNSGNTIVYRDASGNFNAGTITATLNGNASTASFATSASSATTATSATSATTASSATSATNATNATNIGVSSTSTNSSFYPVFVSSTSGNRAPQVDVGLTYNPSSNTLTVQNLNVTGTADIFTTGDDTGSNNAVGTSEETVISETVSSGTYFVVANVTWQGNNDNAVLLRLKGGSTTYAMQHCRGFNGGLQSKCIAGIVSGTSISVTAQSETGSAIFGAGFDTGDLVSSNLQKLFYFRIS